MKKILPVFLSFFLFYSCGSFDNSVTNFSEVGYISTSIANVDDYTINFANGMQAKSRRLIIAVNSTPVLLVIENYLGSGYFYLGKSKINFSSASDIEMLGMNRGRLHYIKSISEDNIIELVDKTKWLVPNPEHVKLLNDWRVNSEIIIPDNKPEEGLYFINPATIESIYVLPMSGNDDTTME